MKIRLLLIFFIFSNSFLFCQKHDYVWQLGVRGNDLYENIKMNFNTVPLTINEVPNRPMRFFTTSTSYSNRTGQLLFYTNGISLMNSNDEIVEGGEVLNPGTVREQFIDFGYNSHHGAFFLAQPENDSILFLFHTGVDFDDDYIMNKLYYTKINIFENGGGGKVIEANVPILEDIEIGPATATKHSNGRDWWILVAEGKTNNYHKFIFTPNELIKVSEQTIGTGKATGSFSKLQKFSENGEMYIDYSGIHGFSLYDFDRCSGGLSNEYRLNFNPNDTIGFYFGAAFSSNSKLLYVSTLYMTEQFGSTSFDIQNPLIIQYDLLSNDIASSADTIGIKDSLMNSPLFFGKGVGFNSLQLAPDGKIYTSNNNFHSIQEPNEKGENCRFMKRFPFTKKAIGRAAPYYPNYRLGPIDGSTCDTLGINNNPIANYRWENWDSLNPLHIEFTDLSYYEPAEWFWEFENLGTSRDTNPEFTFPAPGIYEICLTVRNTNSLNTTCKNVPVGGVSSVEEVFEDYGLSLFPNPSTGFVTFNFEKVQNSATTLDIFNMLGKKVKSIQLAETQISVDIDLTKEQSGIYVAYLGIGNDQSQVKRFIIQK